VEVAKAKSRGISWRSASAVVIRLKVYSSPAAETFKTSQIKNVGTLRRTKINWRENKGLKVVRQVM